MTHWVFLYKNHKFLLNFFLTQCSCSQKMGKQLSHTWKTFFMANLDRYSKKYYTSTGQNMGCLHRIPQKTCQMTESRASLWDLMRKLIYYLHLLKYGLPHQQKLQHWRRRHEHQFSRIWFEQIDRRCICNHYWPHPKFRHHLRWK